MMMPGIDGMTGPRRAKKIDDDLPVLMITAYASIESAIAAMKRGAFDYITKPFKNDEVLVVVRNASSGGGWSPRTARCGRTCRRSATPFGKHHRPQPEDEAGVRPDHPGGAEPDRRS